MRFEEAVRGSGARAGLVWRSAARKMAFWLIRSRSRRGSTSLKTERSGLLTVEKAQTLLARRVADGVLTLLVGQDKIKSEDKKGV